MPQSHSQSQKVGMPNSWCSTKSSSRARSQTPMPSTEKSGAPSAMCRSFMTSSTIGWSRPIWHRSCRSQWGWTSGTTLPIRKKRHSTSSSTPVTVVYRLWSRLTRMPLAVDPKSWSKKGTTRSKMPKETGFLLAHIGTVDRLQLTPQLAGRITANMPSSNKMQLQLQFKSGSRGMERPW